jgi:hypothetical protein
VIVFEAKEYLFDQNDALELDVLGEVDEQSEGDNKGVWWTERDKSMGAENKMSRDEERDGEDGIHKGRV